MSLPTGGRWIPLVGLLLLAGCTRMVRVPETVQIPVITPCVQTLPNDPQVPAPEAFKAMPDYEATLALYLSYIQLYDYRNEARAILQACL